MLIQKIWSRLFLQERPSWGLGWFRIAVAITVGTHVIPTLLPLEDNYLQAAFKEHNPVIFPAWVLAWAARSPDALVIAGAGLFYLFWALFFLGFMTQISCILMTLCCYYFYALNSLHIGTLSWDILLVTLFLMGLTGYPGDWFSLDAWIRDRKGIQPRSRPFFIQRLLQCQLSWTFFYTALVKLYPGNWHSENVYYYLMNNPPEGVIKPFPLREWLAGSPEICRAIGNTVIGGEFFIALALWIPKLRLAAILLGFIFHGMLLITMHVPTIFFFLFPAQFLLFVPPEKYCISKRFRPMHNDAVQPEEPL